VAGKKRSKWGGVRTGAGRPKGSGPGPSPDARKNRIAVMLSDTELGRLEALAKLSDKPIATVAYEFVAGGLRSRARSPRQGRP